MKYIKLNHFDWYVLLYRRIKSPAYVLKDVGEITVIIHSEGRAPYSFPQKLKELDGVLYLPTAAVPPAEETLKEMASEPAGELLVEQMRSIMAANAARGPQKFTFYPESD